MDRSITLDGKEYPLRYDLRGRRDAEKKLGKGLFEALRDGTIESLTTIIWAGIKHTNRKLTVDDVFDLLAAHTANATEYDSLFKECLRAMCEVGLFGKNLTAKEVDRFLGEEEPEAGKAPATVRAAE